MKKPVLLHVMTQKGRGYAPSEQYPEKYHGVSYKKGYLHVAVETVILPLLSLVPVFIYYSLTH